MTQSIESPSWYVPLVTVHATEYGTVTVFGVAVHAIVGTSSGATVGDGVGDGVGTGVGVGVGVGVGDGVGDGVGTGVGVGGEVGAGVGAAVGMGVGFEVGAGCGLPVGITDEVGPGGFDGAAEGPFVDAASPATSPVPPADGLATKTAASTTSFAVAEGRVPGVPSTTVATPPPGEPAIIR